MDASTANRDVTACPAVSIALPGGMRSMVALVVLLLGARFV